MRLLLLTLLALSSHAWAQAPSDAKPPEEAKKLEKIEVKAPDEVDERKQSTAAKIVVPRDEILKYGDTTILHAMKRLPGVTRPPAARRGAGEIRMRGMGAG